MAASRLKPLMDAVLKKGIQIFVYLNISGSIYSKNVFSGLLQGPIKVFLLVWDMK